MSFKEKIKLKVQETKQQFVIAQKNVIELFENLKEELKNDDFHLSWDLSKSISKLYVSAFDTNITVAQIIYQENQKFDFEMLLGDPITKKNISISELEDELIDTFIPAVYKRFQTRLNPLKSFEVCDITMETIGEICGYVYTLGNYDSETKSQVLQKLSGQKRVEIVVSNVSTVNEHLLSNICFLQEREEDRKYMVTGSDFNSKENIIRVIDVEKLIEELTEGPSYSVHTHPVGELKIFQNLEERVKKKLQEEYKNQNPAVSSESVSAEAPVSATSEETKSEDTDAKLLD